HADITAKSTLLEIARAPDAKAMLELVREIVEERLDRAELRRRRRGEEAAEAEGDKPPESVRPYVVRFKASPERPFAVSLSFRTETEPEPRQVIEALRTLIREIEASLAGDQAD
ncbi:MAG TPA: hypothetical protein VLT32_05130, partial [Candidatus Sulfomarinibacteraceae bacterium]|nr:hypothetical protein [Candidatus Sulfomarinibacteraceae bacterium]